MTSKEVLNEIKSLFTLSDSAEKPTEEVTEVVENVELAQPVEEVPKEVQEEPQQTAPINLDDYATKQELADQISELKALFSQIMDIVNPKEKQDIPKSLSSDKVDDIELSEVEAIVPSPEDVVEKTVKHLYSQKRETSVEDNVFNKLFNN